MTTPDRDGPLPAGLLHTPAMVRACAARDIGAIFTLARDQGGLTQSRLARLCDMTPSRVADYIHGRARVRQQHVVERVADGLRIPGDLLGLAPRPWEEDTGPDPESAPPALRPKLADSVVELEVFVDIEVDDDGWVQLTYRHTVLNLTDRPLTRFSRELWFEYGAGPLEITALPTPRHQTSVERIHDAGTFAVFACRISPPVLPMGSATIAYRCRGGRFVDAHYWRQAVTRAMLRLTIDVHQTGIGTLRDVAALEEHPDGATQSIDEHVRWSAEGDEATITLVREDLKPNQFVTLHWEVARDGG